MKTLLYAHTDRLRGLDGFDGRNKRFASTHGTSDASIFHTHQNIHLTPVRENKHMATYSVIVSMITVKKRLSIDESSKAAVASSSSLSRSPSAVNPDASRNITAPYVCGGGIEMGRS